MRPVTRSQLLAAAAAAALAVALAACGSSTGGGGTPPSPTLTCSTLPSATILILNNAACPQALSVSRGTQVTFVNNDTRAHEMFSDPHPEHTDCTELNQVGHLEPGQTRQTGNLNAARRCGFHDHLNDQNRALQGTITIQ
jgi:plastocyanin